MSLVFSASREKGYKRHPLYTVRMGMIQRCYHPSQPAYKNYGGRGITVCDEWKKSPKAFIDWAIGCGWKPGLELDRINNQKGYFPSNCRFVGRVANANNKRSNVWITYNGKTQTLRPWCRELGLDYKLIHCRYKRDKNISPERLFSGESLLKDKYYLEYNGKIKPLAEWCKMLGFSHSSIWRRAKNNPTLPFLKIFRPDSGKKPQRDRSKILFT